jgi:hypothetical protein
MVEGQDAASIFTVLKRFPAVLPPRGGRSLRELLPLRQFAMPTIPQCYQRGFMAPVCTYVIDRPDDRRDS